MNNRLKTAVKEANRPTFIASYFANDFLLVKLRRPHYLLLQTFKKREFINKQIPFEFLRFAPVALIFSNDTPADHSPLFLDILFTYFVLWHVSHMQQGHWVLDNGWQVFYNFLNLLFAFTSQQSLLYEMKDSQTYAKQHVVTF